MSVFRYDLHNIMIQTIQKKGNSKIIEIFPSPNGLMLKCLIGLSNDGGRILEMKCPFLNARFSYTAILFFLLKRDKIERDRK